MIIRMNGVEISGGAAQIHPEIQAEEWQQKLSIGSKMIYGAAAATMVMDMMTTKAHAAASISEAFEPVKALLLDMADPLCYVMFVWGCIECIVGRPASGLNRMKYAGIGYIAINWIPMLMEIIRSSTPTT